jgi:hypothetical protein
MGGNCCAAAQRSSIVGNGNTCGSIGSNKYGYIRKIVCNKITGRGWRVCILITYLGTQAVILGKRALNYSPMMILQPDMKP